MRVAISLLIVLALMASAAGVEYMQGRIPRADPLGRQLLYLPTAEYLNLLSLGNRELLADYLYIWAIQYYSQFSVNERFLYLDKIFGLITDLDPLYRDPYRIGAIIMLMEAESDPNARKKSVFVLLDKGIAAMPDDYSLAEEAAWKAKIFFHDNDLAAHYAQIAAERPNAPHWTKRFYGNLKAGEWTTEQSIAYWEGVLSEAQTDYQRTVSLNHLYDLKVKRDREILNPILHRFADRLGRCPESWDQLIKAGLLKSPPLDPAGSEYGIDTKNCEIVARKEIKKE
jgi:hypothetical protein